VITLALGWAVEQVFFNNTSYTGGYNGVTLASPRLLGLNLGFTVGADVARPAFAIFVLIVLVLLCMMVANLRRSDTGRRMLAVRANERAAAAMGISPGRTKMIAFAFSSFIAGVAGGVMAYQQGQIAPSAFDVFFSMSVLAVAYIGGITTIAGTFIGGLLSAGGVVFYVLQTYVFTTSQNGTNIQNLIAGVGLVLTAVLNPNGLAIGLPASLKLPGRRAAAQPPPRSHGGPPAIEPVGDLPAGGHEDPSIAAGGRS
jgi:branched-chain amino acid transport system permease protein